MLAIEHEVEADLLRKRFLDGMTIQAVANWLNGSLSSAHRKQKRAIKLLTRVLEAKETEVKDKFQVRLEEQLKLPPEAYLIGVKEHLGTVLNALTSPEPAWLVSIEGLGGIGKTALANAVVRQPEIIGQFHNVAWVSAKQQDFLPDIEFDQPPPPALDTKTLIDSLLEQFDQTLMLSRSPEIGRASCRERV